MFDTVTAVIYDDVDVSARFPNDLTTEISIALICNEYSSSAALKLLAFRVNVLPLYDRVWKKLLPHSNGMIRLNADLYYLFHIVPDVTKMHPVIGQIIVRSF